MNGTHRSTDKAEIRSTLFGSEDVTISASFPPSLVTLCHQNLPILTTSLPSPPVMSFLNNPLEKEKRRKGDKYNVKRCYNKVKKVKLTKELRRMM